eukprot:13333086-Ditylum_brightwellii.AAC.1
MHRRGDSGEVHSSKVLPSKEDLYHLACELNDFGAIFHKAGAYDKALHGYREAACVRMVALKVERDGMAVAANLSMADVKERHEMIK